MRKDGLKKLLAEHNHSGETFHKAKQADKKEETGQAVRLLDTIPEDVSNAREMI